MKNKNDLFEDNKIRIVCSCSNPEHQLCFSLYEDNNEAFLHFFLSDMEWYKRILTGIKYIFGYKSKYGHFG
jgi:hypothetical protein